MGSASRRGGSLGLFGVGVFFMISGFVIPFSLAQIQPAGLRGQPLAADYPTYAAGVLVGIVAMYIGGLIYKVPWDIPLSTLPLAVPGLHELAKSPTYDGVIWTVDIELKFYLVCLLFMPLFNKRPRWALLIPLALAPLSLACFHVPADWPIAYWAGW
ncbi:MAG: acyltransferase family protein [Caulobacteraceae bacterium]